MSNSFFELFLATITGVGAYHLGQELYYEIRARINGKRYEEFWDDLEEELQP